MLNFFKSNNLTVIFANVVLIVFYRIIYIIHPVDLSFVYRHAEPASYFFRRLLHLNPQRDYYLLLAGGGFLCFIESMLINQIITSHKVSSKKSYLGGILFVIFTSMVPETAVISPAMVSALFALLCIDKMFDLARPDKLYSYIFDLGFYSGIAMLFYFPSVYLLVFVAIGYFIMRSVSLRESLMILTGFVAVVLVVFTIYFWFDSLPEMVLDVINMQYRISLRSIALNSVQIAVLSWLVILALWVLLNVPSLLFSTVIQTRKYITILIINGLLCLLVLPLMFNFNLSHLIFLFASLSILYTVYFVETKTNLMNEFLFIVLILGSFIFEYLPLFILT